MIKLMEYAALGSMLKASLRTEKQTQSGHTDTIAQGTSGSCAVNLRCDEEKVSGGLGFAVPEATTGRRFDEILDSSLGGNFDCATTRGRAAFGGQVG